MSKKPSSSPLKSCTWGLSCLWGWLMRGLFAAVLLTACAATILLTLGFIEALLPVLHYVLWVLIAYVIVMRDEFKGFREAFYHKSCFFEIGKSFLCCLCHFKTKWCPCGSKNGSCCLKSCCCWEGMDCKIPEVTTEPATPAESTEKKATPAKKKAAPKKAPAKKESSS